ncbi:MAG: hypothetical protein AB1Z98_08570 [Nannocystaceae bacterium]
MSFDPAADPWGTAMLAAAGLWVLSAVIVMLATFVGTSRRTGGRLMLVALLAFLGAAGGGTWVDIQRADAHAQPVAAVEPIEIVAPPVETAHGAPPPESDASSDGATTDDGQPESDSSGGDVDGDDTAEPEPALPAVEPLPSDPEQRRAEIRKRLRDTEAVAASNRKCASLDEVALAWAKLRVIAEDDPGRRQAKDIVDELEQCRRRLLYSISRRYRRAQVDARGAFAEQVVDRFAKEHDLRVVSALSGISHERLRIGGSGLDAARAEQLMNAGLREELRDLAFAHVVLSDTKVAKTYTFEVTPDNELGLPDLVRVGLGERLEL